MSPKCPFTATATSGNTIACCVVVVPWAGGAARCSSSVRAQPLPNLRRGRIAIPGRLTTAALLLKMFLPGDLNTMEMRFDQIIEAVSRGEVDGGVIIHESRFTYQQSGLSCLEDLGRWWEESHDLPLPLGCIVARRSLGEERFQAIEAAVAASVRYAAHHPREPLEYIRRHSQELAEEVVQNHISPVC
jgi:1,4-dihydroxy-6-naphthoate synthase